MGILEDLKNKILLFDGAMGSLLQKYGMKTGEFPETLNLTNPDIVKRIHKEYVEAGADIITANTFQANSLKLPKDFSVSDVITSGITLAKESGAKYVALDIGPIGQIFEPIGTFTFEKAYEIFKEQVIAGEKAGADVILFETFFDLYEAKIAILAAKENSSLPIFCTMSFQEDGRTFMGCDPITQTLTLCGLGIDAIGINCSLGPKEIAPIANTILQYSSIPVMVQANAGLPISKDGKAIYSVEKEEFCNETLKLIQNGVSIVGGCCGTTPEYINLINQKRTLYNRITRNIKKVTAVTSGTKTVILTNRTSVIGERINPTGKKKFKQALIDNKIDYILNEAIDQTTAGSDILDVNVGIMEIDEVSMLREVIKQIQSVTIAPLQIDSSNPSAIEAGARIYNGKPLINSVNGKKESLEQVLPIVKKYGAAVIGLTLDENGIPETAEGRLNIAEKILNTALSYGIPKEDVIIDCLTMTVSTNQNQAVETLKALQMIKSKLGLETVLGVSNISFGLPMRSVVNSTFLSAALARGLSAPILNPMSKDYMQVIHGFRVLSGEDTNSKNYIEIYSNQPKASTQDTAIKTDSLTLIDIVIQGRKELAISKVNEMLNNNITPIEIIDNYFSVALNTIGDQFESQKIFLPQLMQSAETVQAGFSAIKDYVLLKGESTQTKGTIVIATVKGDIHDIGKNIVAMILENYGYNVIDLGKDVGHEKIINAVVKNNAKLIGLSALMTTTAENMKKIIAEIKSAGITSKIMVGGAVLNHEYAMQISADFYAKDALASVEIAKKVFNN